ncbi:MAG: GDP-mannose 4,6-dehydratase [Candidatus Levybacteria bacterium]|nr:GDP-mannose 4,6-dehydratase [Candidatus Levybacteria bacterium]
MVKKVLITGVSGFAGSFLADNLIQNEEYQISGTYLTDNSLQNVDQIKDKINLIKVDLMDEGKVEELIFSIKPDLVFHLAALSSPADSFKNPSQTITNNITAQINILEAIKQAGLIGSRILIISSADIYGAVSQDDLPIDEDTPLKPNNPYAVSKIAQDFLGLQYFLSYGLQIVRVRPFNHIGPRQSPHFVVASFAKKIAGIESGKGDGVLTVGNLDAKRDFTDVRDIVRAYVLTLQKGKIGDVYNIGSGASYKISDILEKLLSFSSAQIKIQKDQSLLRPSDTPELLCDTTKIRQLTGWEPQIKIDQTLKETLDYWREII